MDAAIVVVGVTVPLLMGQWMDMRRRTNGSGPLAAKLDKLEDLMIRHLEGHGRGDH